MCFPACAYVHNCTGPWIHVTLLMTPEYQLLQLLQAHIHIFHCIRSTLHSAVTNTHSDKLCVHKHLLDRSAYLSIVALLILLSVTEVDEPLPSKTDCTIATGRTGGSEVHTSQEEVNARVSPPPTLPPFTPALTPGLTGSSLISIRHFSLRLKKIREITYKVVCVYFFFFFKACYNYQNESVGNKKPCTV